MTTKTDARSIANALSAPMRAVLLTGQTAHGRVTGKTNTIVALMDRGLITGGPEHRWTERAREVVNILDPAAPPAPTTVTRESDGAQFTAGQHVTVEGFPGMHWLITDVYPDSFGTEGAATVWAPAASGHGSRLVQLGLLTHVDPSPAAPAPAEQPQESAFPDAAGPVTPTDYANTLAARLMEVIASVRAPEPETAPTDDVDDLVKRIVRRAQYDALKAMRAVLDGWVTGAKDNHEALAHHGEMVDCWQKFYVDDIQRMIDDAAHELGVPAPPVAS